MRVIFFSAKNDTLKSAAHQKSSTFDVADSGIGMKMQSLHYSAMFGITRNDNATDPLDSIHLIIDPALPK